MTNYFQSLYALLLGILHTRVQGGRLKRFFTFLFSLIVIISSVWLMYRWSYIHTSKQILYLSHPLATDTAQNHYMKVDLRIKSTDGNSLKNRETNPFLYETEMMVESLHQKKEKGKIFQRSHNIKKINDFLKESIVHDEDTLSCKYFPVSDIGNLVVLGIYYNCDYSETFHSEPTHFLFNSDIDEEYTNKYGSSHTFVFENDPTCLALPLGRMLQDKLTEGKEHFAGDFNVDWYYMVTPNNEEVMGFQRKSSSRWITSWIKGFFSMHDISRRYYELDVLTQSIDELNLTFEANEMVEISHPFADAKIGRNSLKLQIIGDHWSDSPGISGAQKIVFFTKNLESENAQLLRMFILMTLCSFALGFFLKTLLDYLWIIIRKIQKA